MGAGVTEPGSIVSRSSVTDVTARMASAVGGPAEAALRAALDRARVDSADLVADLLPGLDLPGLAADPEGATFSHGAAGAALDRALPVASVLDDLFDGRPLPTLKGWRGGRDVMAAGHLGPLGPGAPLLATALDQGATLVVDAADRLHPSIGRVAEHLERAGGSAVDVNLYVSAGREGSFAPHWDDHEVVVLHLAGTKHWQVHAPQAPSPHRSTHGDGTWGPVCWSGTVEAGTWLHLPRGWGHRVRGADDVSVHLTAAIAPLDGLDVLHRLAAAGRRRPAASWPVLMGGPGAVDPQVLRSVLDPGAVDHALTEARLATWVDMPGRSTGSPADLLRVLVGGPRTEVRVRSALPGEVLIGAGPDGVDRLVATRSVYDVAPAAWTFVAGLLDGRARRLAELDAGPAMDGGLAPAAVVDDLLRAGLLEVLPDPPGWGVVAAGAP